MKAQIVTRLSPLLPISVVSFIPALAIGAGVAAIKDQPFHQDAGANIVVYSKLVEGGPLVRIETASRMFTIDREKLAGNIEVMPALPVNITTNTELEPVRLAAKEYRDFSTRFPKSAPVLTPHITALETCIKDFEDGKARYNGKWMPKEDALAAMERDEQSRIEAEAAIKRKRAEKRAFEESQKAQGLAQYNGKWIPADEARRLTRADQEKAKEVAAAKARAEQIAKNTRRLAGKIDQFTKDGMIVDTFLGTVQTPKYDPGTNRPKDYRDNTILVVGHPKANEKVDGDWFDVDAVYMGVYEYRTVIGSIRRIKKFQVIKSYY